MKRIIFNLKIALLVFLVLSLFLTAGLVMQQYRSKTRLAVAAGENLASLRQRYAQAGSIYDIYGEKLAWSEGGMRLYHQNSNMAKAVLHTVGDYTQRIDNTVETRYQAELLGTNRNIFHQFYLDVQGKGLRGDDITLTLDSRLTLKAAELLGDNRGAIVMINYKTGELIVSTSSPSVDPQSVIDYENIPDTGLFNRAIRGAYAPGSVFKLVTALAWLESPEYDSDFHVNCHGDSTIHPDYAHENGNGHGVVYLEDALVKSCNVFFGELGVKIGREELLRTADEMGIGHDFKIEKLNGRSSEIDCEDSEYQLSWLAIGQPVDNSALSVSPLEVARITGAIANDGILMSSRIIDHYNDPSGHKFGNIKIKEEKKMLDADLSADLKSMMLKVVAEGSGSNASLSDHQIAGKTGTVQVEGQENNALFTGFIAEEDFPYAITVVVEEGGSGGRSAAPIARQLFQYAIERNN